MFILEVIAGTPPYVWLLLAYLVWRGIKSSKESELDLIKMLIIPVIFIVWGLEELVSKFVYADMGLLVYLVFAVVGAFAGKALYGTFRSIYAKDGQFYRSGSYLPLVIVLINFSVKYVLGASIAIQPDLHSSLAFTVLSCIASGCSVGLFIGGVWNAYQAAFRLKSKVA